MSKDTSGPAFPEMAHPAHGYGSVESVKPGMTRRQHYASTCPLTYTEVAGMLGFTIHASTKPMSAHARKEFFDTWARLRFEYADSMLAAEQEGK